MANKAQAQKRMIAEVVACIELLGGIKHGDGVGQGCWAVMTTGGVATITPSSDFGERGKAAAYTLFCRFENREQAKAAGFLERHNFSGKWNHHGIADAKEGCAIVKSLLRGAPQTPAEQRAALLAWRTKEALQRLVWKAEDHLALLEGRTVTGEAVKESAGYVLQLKEYIANAKALIKEGEAAHG